MESGKGYSKGGMVAINGGRVINIKAESTLQLFDAEASIEMKSSFSGSSNSGDIMLSTGSSGNSTAGSVDISAGRSASSSVGSSILVGSGDNVAKQGLTGDYPLMEDPE